MYTNRVVIAVLLAMGTPAAGREPLAAEDPLPELYRLVRCDVACRGNDRRLADFILRFFSPDGASGDFIKDGLRVFSARERFRALMSGLERGDPVRREAVLDELRRAIRSNCGIDLQKAPRSPDEARRALEAVRQNGLIDLLILLPGGRGYLLGAVDLDLSGIRSRSGIEVLAEFVEDIMDRDTDQEAQALCAPRLGLVYFLAGEPARLERLSRSLSDEQRRRPVTVAGQARTLGDYLDGLIRGISGLPLKKHLPSDAEVRAVLLKLADGKLDLDFRTDYRTAIAFLSQPIGPISLENALTALTEFGRPAVGPIAKLLDSPETFMRIHAAKALGLMGPTAEPALPALLRRFKDIDPRVRMFAMGAVVNIRWPDPYLSKEADPPLGSPDPPSALLIAGYEEVLTDDDSGARKLAAICLEMIRRRPSRPK